MSIVVLLFSCPARYWTVLGSTPASVSYTHLQVILPMICMMIGRASFGYPGNAAQAMWSTVIARMAMIFMAFAFNDIFWDMAHLPITG